MSTYEDNYLAHHGVIGQKWGVRRYQNPDGSLTAEGRAHYGVGEASVLQNHGLQRMNGASQARLTKFMKRATFDFASKKGQRNQDITMPGAIKKFNSNKNYRSWCTQAAVYGIQAYQKCGYGYIGNFNDLAAREAFLFGKDTSAYAQLALGAMLNGNVKFRGAVASNIVSEVLKAPDAKMDNPGYESIRQAIRNSGMTPKQAQAYVDRINRMLNLSDGLPSQIRIRVLTEQGWGSNRNYGGSNGDTDRNEKYMSLKEKNKRMLTKD